MTTPPVFTIDERVYLLRSGGLELATVIDRVATWAERPELSEWVYTLRADADGTIWHTLRPYKLDELSLFSD